MLPNGEIIEIGRNGVLDEPGYDLLGLLTGSEGTLGIVTKITVRILKSPEGKQTALAYFDRVEDGSQAVSDIISAGIVPAALEMMDKTAIEAVEAAAFPVGHPKDIEAVLLIEVDGIAAGIEEQINKIIEVCKKTMSVRFEPLKMRKKEDGGGPIVKQALGQWVPFLLII